MSNQLAFELGYTPETYGDTADEMAFENMPNDDKYMEPEPYLTILREHWEEIGSPNPMRIIISAPEVPLDNSDDEFERRHNDFSAGWHAAVWDASTNGITRADHLPIAWQSFVEGNPPDSDDPVPGPDENYQTSICVNDGCRVVQFREDLSMARRRCPGCGTFAHSKKALDEAEEVNLLGDDTPESARRMD